MSGRQAKGLGGKVDDFRLPNSQGDYVRLAELVSHQPVVLVVCPEESEADVVERLIAYRAGFQELLLAGVCVAALVRGELEMAERVRLNNSLPYPLLCDVDGGIVEELAAPGDRGCVWIIGPELELRFMALRSLDTSAEPAAVTGYARSCLPLPRKGS